jgi:hypothetical protein
MAFGRIARALKQDWMRTGNIDFYASALESSSPQPLRLLVEEIRVTEGAVGQDIAELRWRLATLEEGKELVVCWNARQIGYRTTRLILQPWDRWNGRRCCGRAGPH